MPTQFNDLDFSPSDWKKIQIKFLEVATPLDKARFHFHFSGSSADLVLKELKSYQNYDGGFGHGLEADFHLPNSTPMATSVGIRILESLPKSPKRNAMIRQALRFLKGCFYIDRPGWFAVIPAVNEFPHAPWWDFDLNKNQTIIDTHWGNPSAEIIAYLWNFRSMIPNWDLEPLLEHATHFFENLSTFSSEHEIYCYLHLYHFCPNKYRQRLKTNLQKAVKSLVVTDETQWNTYVPQPVHFLLYPEDTEQWFNVTDIHKNLLYLREKLKQEKILSPNWEWGTYPQYWAEAKKIWAAKLTLRALKTLKQFSKQMMVNG